MQKNEKLFELLGEIPDEYLEDAQNSNSVKIKKKTISIKTIVSAAAAIALIISVPAVLKHSIKKPQNNKDDPTSSVVSDISAVENYLSCGTGPERPADYSPDKKYDYCDLNAVGLNNDPEVSYAEYQIRTVFADQDLAEQIINDMYDLEDEFLNEYGKKRTDSDVVCSVDGIVNGYAFITVYIDSIKTFSGKCMVYDLLSRKKIDKESDLFYSGEDYLSEISKILEEDSFILDTSKPIRFSDSAIICSGKSVEDENIDDNHYLYFDQHPEMYDLIITSRYADFSDIIKNEYYAVDDHADWYFPTTTTVPDGYTIKCNTVSSRFYTKQEIEERNEIHLGHCRDFLSCLSEDFINDLPENTVVQLYDIGEDGRNVNDLFPDVILYGYDTSVAYTFDTENKVIVDYKLLCPEWENYIESYFDSSRQAISDKPEPLTNIDTTDLNEYTVEDWYPYWDYQLLEGPDENDDGSIKKAAFIYVLRNINTGEKLYAVLRIPYDKIYKPYLDFQVNKFSVFDSLTFLDA